ncbi:MAG: ATP-dependent zinc metalloprotease FtsH [Candidatus Dependentiae bacterium]|nr:ATP-dependent zinc metalloprotease FtsH [Candidatus Dependentiae bacterium]
MKNLKKKFKKFGGTPRNLLIFALLFVAGLALLTKLAERTQKTESLIYSEFLNKVEGDQVSSVQVVGNQVFGKYKTGGQFEVNIANNPKNWDLLREHKVAVSVIEQAGGNFSIWPFLLLLLIGGLIFVAWFFIRQSRGQGGGAGGIFEIAKSKARMFLPSQVGVSFTDVAGADEAKDELRDVIDFLKNPSKYRKIGAQLPRGVLLVGEPGNGKTMLAKAVAGEANCPFFSITGSDFIEIFVGVGAARIRDLFARARKHAPCIVFIDEIDAIGRRRGSGLGGGHDEREQALNQLLTEMDGFASSDAPIVVLAATNMPGVLDRALLRPGRFDRRVTVPFPDEQARAQLIEIHAKKIRIDPSVDREKIVKESAGFTFADLANCMNQAAINASKQGRDIVLQEDFDVAFRKVMESQKASRSEHNTSGAEEGTARVYMPSQVKVRFSDVAGVEEAKEELWDFIDYLKNPERYKKIGAKLTRGVLLVGDPGNGKTMLARAVAGEAGRPFFSASGSEFIEKYVGVGAARVRDLFAQARRQAPSIIFIDEIDAIGAQRDGFGAHSEHAQTLNQLLTEMDGFEAEGPSVIVLAATNRPEMLDKALTRAGRFDRQVDVPYPDVKSRKAILEVHVRNVKLAPDIDLEKIARGTSGFSGADIANLINEAAMDAVRNGREALTLADFEEARDKILMGKRSKSMVQTAEDLKATAYHEAGHALMTLLQPDTTDPLHKVTIAPRGRALGYSASLPERDKYAQSKEELLARIITMLGGRAGEEIGVGRQFTGVTSDLQRASHIARNMVTSFGMSPELGLVAYPQGRAGVEYSQQTAAKIDEEVSQLMTRCYNKAVELLKTNRDKLEKLAQALLEKETLDAEEIYALLDIAPRVVHKLS